MSRVAVVDGDYCPVLEKCTTTPLLSVIPGVSSVVRPNTPLHDQEQGEVTAGTATSHTTAGADRGDLAETGNIGHSLQLGDGYNESPLTP